MPSGLAWPIYFLLIPIEVMGMFVKPFALTMRLAANMSGGHIAILAILSFVFIFNQQFESQLLGIGVGALVSVPLAVGVSASKIIVILVQAYVFTLLDVGVHRHGHPRSSLARRRLRPTSMPGSVIAGTADPSTVGEYNTIRTGLNGKDPGGSKESRPPL